MSYGPLVMTKRTKRTIFFSILGVLAIVLTAGIYLYNKGPVCVKCAAGKQVTAVILYQTFAADSTRAKREYTSQILEVSGIVKQVSQNLQNQAIILIQTNEPGAAVNCTMEGPADKIRKGDTVALKGICTGMDTGAVELGIPGDVYLTRCYLAK